MSGSAGQRLVPIERHWRRSPPWLSFFVRREMKVMRFILGLIGFIVAWIAVGGLITLVVHAIFPGIGSSFWA